VRIALIANAKSPEAMEQLRSAVRELRESGHEVSPRLTFESGDALRFASEATAEGVSLIIVAGGDGTINEVANGIHGQLSRTPRGGSGAAGHLPRLGIIPLGTANDLAHSIGVPMDVPAAVHAAVHGMPVETNFGRVNDRYFLNVSVGGFSAGATGEAAPATKRALGTLAYVIEGIRKFAALEPSHARFTAGEVIYEGPFLLFAVGNTRRTGGGNQLTPHAEIADGLLDICIVKEVSRVEFLRLLPDLRAGEHLDHPAVIYLQVNELTVEAEADLSVNADGEPVDGRRFHYSVSPHKLLLVAPADAEIPAE
jgi:lipid kinase YegS